MMSPTDKPLVWLHGEVKTPPFSPEARMEAGFLLRRLQGGEKLSMPQSRPMSSIGARCHELRVNDENLTWRIIYRIDDDAIIIAEVFDKKTNDTPKNIIEIQQLGEINKEEIMDAKKKKKLEEAGWRIGDAKDFLGLTPRELEYIELKMSLAKSLSKIRREKNISQVELAKRIGSSQSRVAKMEACDSTVSIDLLVRTLIELDVSKRQLSKIIV